MDHILEYEDFLNENKKIDKVIKVKLLPLDFRNGVSAPEYDWAKVAAFMSGAARNAKSWSVTFTIPKVANFTFNNRVGVNIKPKTDVRSDVFRDGDGTNLDYGSLRQPTFKMKDDNEFILRKTTYPLIRAAMVDKLDFGNEEIEYDGSWRDLPKSEPHIYDPKTRDDDFWNWVVSGGKPIVGRATDAPNDIMAKDALKQLHSMVPKELVVKCKRLNP